MILYFCHPIYEAGSNEKSRLEAEKHNKKVLAICDKAWTDRKERKVCIRALTASKALLDYMASDGLSGEPPVSLSATSKDEVQETTRNAYGSLQCRLDTLVNGAICRVEYDVEGIPLKREEVRKNSCNGAQVGTRPRC